MYLLFACLTGLLLLWGDKSSSNLTPFAALGFTLAVVFWPATIAYTAYRAVRARGAW